MTFSKHPEPKDPEPFIHPVGGDERFEMFVSLGRGSDSVSTFNFYLRPKTPEARAELERAFEVLKASKGMTDIKFSDVYFEGEGMCYSGINNFQVLTKLIGRNNLKERITPPQILLDALKLDFTLRDQAIKNLGYYVGIPAEEIAHGGKA